MLQVRSAARHLVPPRSRVDFLSRSQLCAINCNGKPPSRQVRKAIFNLHVWWPKWRHASRAVYGSGVRHRHDSSNKPNGGLAFGLLNARSVTSKSTAISDTVSAQHLDVMAITETWHRTSAQLSAVSAFGLSNNNKW